MKKQILHLSTFKIPGDNPSEIMKLTFQKKQNNWLIIYVTLSEVPNLRYTNPKSKSYDNLNNSGGIFL